MDNILTDEQPGPFQSYAIQELAKDLSIMQGKLGKASKDKENPFFKKNYADLESIWDVARELLPAHGLAIVQTIWGTATNPVVITTLIHKSGQWIRGFHTLQSRKPDDPQVAGSLITYGRRYGMAAILGIVQSDDDGNLGSKDTDTKTTQTTKTPPKTEKVPVKMPVSTKKPTDTPQVGLSKARQDQIASQCDKLSEDQCQEFLKKMGVDSFSDLGKIQNYTQAVKAIASIKKGGKKEATDDIPF